MPDKMNVLVIGAGTMGHCIAQVYAAAGYPTTVADQNPEQLEIAKRSVAANLEILKAEAAIDETGVKNVEKLLHYASNIDQAAGQAGLIVEAIPEIPDLKKELFKQLDKLCAPETLFTSTTSALNIYDFIEVSYPERLVITHFCNPAHIIPLVEIVRGPQTPDETIARAKAICADIGKVPIVINQYIPGFIVNRLNCALAREATYIVGKGWSSIEDVDKALCNNAGLKLAFEGPLELQDYIGWDISVLAGKVIAPLLCNNDDVTLAESMVSQGRLGLKSGRGVKDYSNVDRLEVQDRRNRKILRVYRTVESFRD